jgi:hypothetical protein
MKDPLHLRIKMSFLIFTILLFQTSLPVSAEDADTEDPSLQITPDTLSISQPNDVIGFELFSLDDVSGEADALAEALIENDPSGVLSPAAAVGYTISLGVPVLSGASFRFFPADALHADGTCDFGITYVSTLTCYYATPVQNAVDDAAEGSLVSIGVGTFTEQVLIQKNLTLQGAGMGSTILQAPGGSLTVTPGTGVHAVLSISSLDPSISSVLVHLYGFSVDGNGQGALNDQFTGIHYYSSGGTINQVQLGNINGAALPGDGNGVGVLVNHPQNQNITTFVDMQSLVVEDSQQAGILLAEPGTSAVIESSMIRDSAAGSGIEVSFGASAMILNNTIAGNAVGVRVTGNATNAQSPAPQTVVAGNNLLDNQTGVLVEVDTQRGYGDALAVVTINRLVGNQVGVVNANVAESVNAENNWWGCNDGAGMDGCDTILGTVDADPWLTLSWLRGTGTFNVTVEQSVELYPTLSINSQGNDTWGISYFLPDGILGFFSYPPSLGEVDPNPLFTFYDDMPFQYTAFQVPGMDTVCVTVDNAELCGRVSVNPAEPSPLPGLTPLVIPLYLPETSISANFPGGQGMFFLVLERMGEAEEKEWVRITIPSWSLPTGALVTLTHFVESTLPSALPAGIEYLGPAFLLQASDLNGADIPSFNAQASFYFSLPDGFVLPDDAQLAVLHMNTESGEWEEVPASVGEDFVEVVSNQPGTYVLVIMH